MIAIIVMSFKDLFCIKNGLHSLAVIKIVICLKESFGIFFFFFKLDLVYTKSGK